jgi:predicted sugar kinase
MLWAARRFVDELPPELPASMMRRGDTSGMAAALATMGGGGDVPALGVLNRVDEGDIHLALIDINPAVINDDGEVGVAVGAQGDGW